MTGVSVEPELSSDSAGAEKKHDHMIDSVFGLASQSQRPDIIPVSRANRDTEKPALIVLKSETISREAVPEHDNSVPSLGASRGSEQTFINSVNAKKQPISSGQRLAYADVLKSEKSVDLRKPVEQTDDRGRHLDGSARELDSNRHTKPPLPSSPAIPPSVDAHDKQDSKLHQRNEEVAALTDKADAGDIPVFSHAQSGVSSSDSARTDEDLNYDPVATPTVNSVKSPGLRSDEMSGEVNSSVPLIRSDRKSHDIENGAILQKGGGGTPQRRKNISSEDRLFQPAGCRRPVSEDSSPSKSLGSPKVSAHQASASHKPVEASPIALTSIGNRSFRKVLMDSANLSSPLTSQKMHEAEDTTGEKPVAQESESKKSIENQTLKETKLRTTVNSSQVKSSSASNRRSDTLSETSLKSDYKTSALSEQHVEYAETHSRSPAPGINDTDGETTAKSKAANRSIEDSHTQAVLRIVLQVTKHQYTNRALKVPTAGSELGSQQNLVTSNSGDNIIRYDASWSSSLVPVRDHGTMAEMQRPTQGAEEKNVLPGIATRELLENNTPPESNGPLDRTALAVNRAELPWSQRGRSDVSSALLHDHSPDSKDRKTSASASEEGESLLYGSSRLASQKNDANMEGIHC
ncbi:hypothetical protein ACEPAI_4330 [Sanghuangporus weigelae]